MKNLDTIQAFHAYRAANYPLSADSIHHEKAALVRVVNILREQLELEDILAFSEADFKRMHLYMIDTYMARSIDLTYTFFKMYWNWLLAEKIVEHNPFPAKLSLKLATTGVVHPQPPEFLFEIRKFRGRIIFALAFELAFSAGLRIGEIKQLKLQYIDFKDIPYDSEEKRKSIYCGGSITLDPTLMRLKTKRKRKTYLSKFTANLLKKYIEHFRVTDPRTRLFPSEIQLGPFIEKFLDKQGPSETKVVETQNEPSSFEDQEDIQADPEFLKALKQKAERDKKKKVSSGKNKTGPKQVAGRTRKTIHKTTRIHSLRHSFTCTMFYRNYHGCRRDSETLRLMLGHASIDQTQEYLQSVDFIADDRVWKRIMLGGPGDWDSVVMAIGYNGKKLRS